MQFGLMIIGDEILQGLRQDKHFAFFKQLLESKGLQLAWVQYLPDDRTLLTRQFRRSFQDGGCVFSTGGIGATTDDHTRQAVATALNLPLVSNPQALRQIETITRQRGESLDSATHRQRARLADFVEGADLIPNPFNGIAGFSIQQHYFFPGFPEMAHPMAKWVLDHYYADQFFNERRQSKAAIVEGLPEAVIGPLMETIEARWPGIKTFSLPTIRHDLPVAEQTHHYQVEFGLKANGASCAQLPEAWAYAQARLKTLGAKVIKEIMKGSE